MAGEKKSAGDKQELLTPEQQAMWRRRHRDKIKSLGPEQKKEFRKQLLQRVRNMDAWNLAKQRTELQAEWDALPADQQEKIRVRIAEKKDD